MGYTKPFLFCFLFVLLFVFTNFISYTQTLDENRAGSWLVISGNNKIHERWSIPTVGILRHHDILEQYEFAFFRTGVSYQLNPSSTFTTGVAHLSSKNYTGSEEFKNATQFWVYEEYTLKMKAFSHRWRLETRWKKNAESLHINNRVRYRLLYIKPLSKNTYIKSFNEIFLNLERPLFNQNRAYIGLGHILTPSIKLDIGYLKNHFKTSDHDVIRMGVTFKTDFTKKDIAQLTATHSKQ